MAKSFHELAPRTQKVIMVLFCGLTVIGAWQVVIGPQQERLAAVRAKLASVQAEVARSQATAAKLPQLERDIKASEAALQQTTAVLPDEKDPQDVLRNLHDMAAESTLNLASFTPKPIAVKPQYAEWPITLGLEGTYHDLGRFFDRIASMSRLMSISSLDIKVESSKPGNSKGSITASCIATTFVFNKELMMAPPSGGKK